MALASTAAAVFLVGGCDLAAAMTREGHLDMAGRGTLTEKIALSILDREGITVIWELQVAAAGAYQTGHPQAAAAILEIAEAAEAAWLATKGRLRDRLADLIASLG